VPAGVPGKSNGSPAMLWRAEKLRALRAEWDARPFPPEGSVNRSGAEAALGISPSTLHLWMRHKRLDYIGELMTGPNGVACRVYRLDLLLAARERMKATESVEAILPAGYVDFAGAARFLGIHPFTMNSWQRQGKVGRGKALSVPGCGRRHVFAIADLEQAKTRIEADKSRPTAPEGFIELHDVTAALGISPQTLYKWEQAGRLPEGRVVPIPGSSARTKIYPIANVEQVRDEIRAAAANFPPPGWLTMREAAKRANVSVLVWKCWLMEGRVERWQWASRPTMARCKLFAVEDVERVVAEQGRDHDFLLEPDGHGGWRLPDGYVGRAEAAAMLGATETTFVRWQSLGWINFGRWARSPAGEGGPGRRAYDANRLAAMVAAFEARGGPRMDDADSGVARVPVFAPDGVARDALIDVADLPMVGGARWYWAIPGNDLVAAEMGCVASRLPDGRQQALRVRLLGATPSERSRTMHLNGDRLDFRRANLLLKDGSEHIHGSRKMRRTGQGQVPTSRFKGVHWKRGEGTWGANIMKDGVAHRLGRFDDEIAAAQAYDEAARELYGPMAYQNFPHGVDAWLSNEAQASQEEDAPCDSPAEAIRFAPARAA
jgi:predicted site-specific integrase-resolvase